MNESFYLDPESVRGSVSGYIRELERLSGQLRATEEAITALTGADVLSGRGFDAGKQHLSAFRDIIGAMINLDSFDIADGRSLASKVGSEVLDGEELYAAYEGFRRAASDAEDTAGYYYWKSRGEYPRETREWYEEMYYSYRESAEAYRQMADRVARRIRLYGDIEAATGGLFGETAGMRRTLVSALDDLTAIIAGGPEAGAYVPTWKSDYLRMLSAVMPLSAGAKDRLRTLGLSDQDIAAIYACARSERDLDALGSLLGGRYGELRETDPGTLSVETISAIFSFLTLLAARGQSGEIELAVNGLLSTDGRHRRAVPNQDRFEKGQYGRSTDTSQISYGEDYFGALLSVGKMEQYRIIGEAMGGSIGQDRAWYDSVVAMNGLLASLGELAFGGNMLYDVQGRYTIGAWGDAPGGTGPGFFEAAFSNRFLVGARVSGLTIDASGYVYDLQYQVSEGRPDPDPDRDGRWLDGTDETLHVEGMTFMNSRDIGAALTASRIDRYIEAQKHLTEKWAWKWMSGQIGERVNGSAEQFMKVFGSSQNDLLENGTGLARSGLKDADLLLDKGGILSGCLLPFFNIFAFEARYQAERTKAKGDILNTLLELSILDMGAVSCYSVRVGGPYAPTQLRICDQGLYDLSVAESLGAIASSEVSPAKALGIEEAVRLALKDGRVGDPDARRMLGLFLGEGDAFVLEAVDPDNAKALWNAVRAIESAYDDLHGVAGSFGDRLDVFALLREGAR